MIHLITSLISILLYIIIIYAGIIFFLKERNHRLYTIVTVCFFLHIILLGIIEFVYFSTPDPRLTIFASDGNYYSMHARIISAILNGRPLSYITGLVAVNPWISEYTMRAMIPPVYTYQVGYIGYFYAILYSVFGYHPIMINLLNIILHLASGVLVYLISKKIFDKTTGYIAASIFLFNPILFYYATTKITESIYIFLLCLVIFITLSIPKKQSFKHIILKFVILIISLFFFYLLKWKLVLPLALSSFLYFTIIAVYRYKIHIRLMLMAFLLIPGAVFYQKIMRIFDGFIHTLAVSHFGFISAGGQTYSIINSVSGFESFTAFGKVKYLLLSWVHFIFEPLEYSSLSYLFYMPFKIIFIALFGMSLAGMTLSLKRKFAGVKLLIIYFILMGTTLAAASGNVGTMLRHRDAVSLVIFIFAAYFIRLCLPYGNIDEKL